MRAIRNRRNVSKSKGNSGGEHLDQQTLEGRKLIHSIDEFRGYNAPSPSGEVVSSNSISQSEGSPCNESTLPLERTDQDYSTTKTSALRQLPDPVPTGNSRFFVCPRCRSKAVKNGHNCSKQPPEQTYKCVNNHRFTRERSNRAAELDLEQLTTLYLVRNASLSALRINAGSRPKSTLWNKITKTATEAPSGIEFSKQVKPIARWGLVLNLDTTGLKIKGKQYVYLHFSDIPSGDQLDYGVSMREDKETIVNHLGKIRYQLDYHPKLVVSDLAPELLEAAKGVYPNIPIQGCLFHLQMLLNKRLPTWKPYRNQRSNSSQRLKQMQHWVKIKQQVMDVAHARDEQARQTAIDELMKIDTSRDHKAHQAIQHFLANLNYYHPVDQLESIGVSRNMRYSNRCESDIGQIKRLWNAHKGLRNLEVARKCIDYFWWKKRVARSYPSMDQLGSGRIPSSERSEAK